MWPHGTCHAKNKVRTKKPAATLEETPPIAAPKPPPCIAASSLFPHLRQW